MKHHRKRKPGKPATRRQPERGQDLLEYALLIGLLSIAIVGSALLIGQNLLDAYEQIGQTFGTIAAGVGAPARVLGYRMAAPASPAASRISPSIGKDNTYLENRTAADAEKEVDLSSNSPVADSMIPSPEDSPADLIALASESAAPVQLYLPIVDKQDLTHVPAFCPIPRQIGQYPIKNNSKSPAISQAIGSNYLYFAVFYNATR